MKRTFPQQTNSFLLSSTKRRGLTRQMVRYQSVSYSSVTATATLLGCTALASGLMGMLPAQASQASVASQPELMGVANASLRLAAPLTAEASPGKAELTEGLVSANTVVTTISPIALLPANTTPFFNASRFQIAMTVGAQLNDLGEGQIESPPADPGVSFALLNASPTVTPGDETFAQSSMAVILEQASPPEIEPETAVSRLIALVASLGLEPPSQERFWGTTTLLSAATTANQLSLGSQFTQPLTGVSVPGSGTAGQLGVGGVDKLLDDQHSVSKGVRGTGLGAQVSPLPWNTWLNPRQYPTNPQPSVVISINGPTIEHGLTPPIARRSLFPRLPNLDLPPLASPDRYLPGKAPYSVTNQFTWPARGVFTSGFGPRWGRMHRGIDIAGPIGTPIVAAAAGTVVTSEWNSGGYGNLVEIRHPDGSLTLYGHNNRLLARVGQQVEQGQQIAEMGSTGRSTGPHVHFEIHPYGKGAVNPMLFLSRG